MTVAAIIQARMGSSRFPGKVLAPLCGKPVLQHVLERCKQIKGVDVVVVATPHDDWARIADAVNLCGATLWAIPVDENDVLARYLQVAQKENATIIMRITGDCPLIDPDVCGDVLNLVTENGADYASNVYPTRSYPRGFDCEVFTMELLERAASEATVAYDREHVTSYMQRESRNGKTLHNSYDASRVNWCVDYPEDIARLEQVMMEAA